MKLLPSSETKDKNDGNISQLRITEVVLVYEILANNVYLHGLRIMHKLSRDNPFGSLIDISPSVFYFYKLLKF